MLLFGFFVSACGSSDHDITDIPETLVLLLQQQEANCTRSNCWEGLIPGETTFADARHILETRYGKQNVRVGQHYIGWDTDSCGGYRGGSLHFLDQDTINTISIGIAEGELTVAELIAQLGEPSFIWVVRAFSSEALCAGSDITYPTLGIHATTRPEAGSVGITPTQTIQGLLFMTPDMAQNLTVTDTVKIEWQGYQDYCGLFAIRLGTPVPASIQIATPHTNNQ
jgi:hypothetical protein